MLLNAAPGDYEAAREHAVTAIAAALDGRVLSRDALHEDLRGRLPAELLPWCPSCESHHARRGLLSMAALDGRLCIAGREGRQNTFARTDQWIELEPADGGELVRRYLHHLGPSTHTDFAAWAGHRAVARQGAVEGASTTSSSRSARRSSWPTTRRRSRARRSPAAHGCSVPAIRC